MPEASMQTWFVLVCGSRARARLAGAEWGDGAPRAAAGVRGVAPSKEAAHVRGSRTRSGAMGPRERPRGFGA